MKFSRGETIHVILDTQADIGIRRIWEKVAKDIQDTTGAQCVLAVPGEACAQAVLVGTFGSGAFADKLAERVPQLTQLAGKWEAYGFYLMRRPLPEVEEGLVILGSDKLGTIYGMFHLSELLGVTAWGFWGDVTPPAYESVTLISDGQTADQAGVCEPDNVRGQAEICEPDNARGQAEICEPDNVRGQAKTCEPDNARGQAETCGTESGRKHTYGAHPAQLCLHIENKISKEPSVKYRGFFINDEWPCFGSWTTEHYGGFTAEMYEHVFEYLLRMKGNYLWPAMWSSSFLLDGPGLASMELATEYGIYIGMSHHEPCMRSGEEFSLFKGEDSVYGMDWDYTKNKDGLLRFWEDGLARVKDQNIFPTVGMRGERDSKLLEEGSTVDENVRQLKEIITQQRRIIRECVEAERGPVPQLFAIYKEVEEYYFGDGQSEGLQGFPELDDVTLLFSDDNFGHMRALPQTGHRGGCGMYYHLDYHGAPISYEWVNSTPLTHIWEQMTEAYEYGVRELWIVNVGDVKFQEYSLGYFMELAYDFERLGTGCYPRTLAYTQEWIRRLFGSYLPEDVCRKIAWIQEESVRLHGLRRAEALNDRVYHPAYDHEGETMLRRAERLEQENEQMRELLAGTPCADAYFSMIWYPAAGIANLLKMHLYAGFNHLYAAQGLALANVYGEKLQECIRRDAELGEQMAAFGDGKWRGMERAAHIGFVNWNDQDWRYPLRHVVTLPEKPRLSVARTDDVRIYTNQYFPQPLVIEDLGFAGTEEVTLRIANSGQGVLHWQIDGCPDCLEFSATEGDTELADEVRIRLRPEKGAGVRPQEISCGTAGDQEKEASCDSPSRDLQGTACSACAEEGREITCSIRSGQEYVPLRILLHGSARDGRQPAFLLQGGRCAFDAATCSRKTPGTYRGAEAAFEKLEDYGKFGSGMKVFPVTADFLSSPADAPCLYYEVESPKPCAAVLALHTSPANPLVYGGMLRLGVSVNGEDWQTAVIADETYRGGENTCREWSEAVLNQEHVAELPITLRAGRNQIAVAAREAGVVLERLVIYEEGKSPEPSYFGPRG